MPESMRDCPACHTRVLPTADGGCPACRRYSFATGGLLESALPKPPAPRPPGWALDRTRTVFIILSAAFMAPITVGYLVMAAVGYVPATIASPPPWVRWAILAFGLGGLLALAALWGLWKRKRWGLYLFDAFAVLAMVLNLKLGVALPLALLGLLGPISLTVLVVLRWRTFN